MRIIQIIIGQNYWELLFIQVSEGGEGANN